MNQAAAYYEGTEHSYRTLCPSLSGHMNMGLWPSQTLRSAQETLVLNGLNRVRASNHTIQVVVDAGSGWGGSRQLVAEVFPNAHYTGVNVSQKQIDAARALNQGVGNTEYQYGSVEEHAKEDWKADLFMSVEAAFHFENKRNLYRNVAKRAKSMLLLEICVTNEDNVRNNPLLRPALGHAWSLDTYNSELTTCGYKNVEIQDLSSQVFDGFSDYLRTISLPSYEGNAAVLRQFRLAFGRMAKLAKQGELQYVQIWADK